MELKLVSGNCGCLRLYGFDKVDGLNMTDADKLPANMIGLEGIVLESDVYLVQQVFANKPELIAYLNTSFAEEHGLMGMFASGSGSTITYSNIENFETGEIIMVYKNEYRCYQVGEPDGEEMPSDTPFAKLGNGATVQGILDGIVAEGNWELLSAVTIGTASPAYPPTGTEIYTQPLNNTTVWLTVQQKP